MISYILESSKIGYLAILLTLTPLILLLDSIYNFLPAIDVFGIGKNGYKIIALILSILGIVMLFVFYSEFINIGYSKEDVFLGFLKPRPSVKIPFSQLSRYEIKTPPKVPENRGLIIYLKNGKQYKSTYSGPEYRDNFNKAVEELNKILQK